MPELMCVHPLELPRAFHNAADSLLEASKTFAHLDLLVSSLSFAVASTSSRKGVSIMSSKRFIPALLCCGLVSLRALGICAPRCGAGQVVSGVYKVTETTDLGTQMRVTMYIRLTNAGDDRIFVIQARLRSFLHPGKSEDKPAGVILEPHGSAEFTQDFTISNQEYEMWSKGARPHLGLKVQVAGGTETTMTISLMQRPGSR